jgi:hypothetical protein
MLFYPLKARIEKTITAPTAPTTANLKIDLLCSCS